ncbi:MAG: tetratricopeptide repeat protein [Deltaproteobacteria bacterium]|nr:tetratricopeptide repeat protein [Deltaproteobacteria bacterium]
MRKEKLLAAAGKYQQRGQWPKCRTMLEQAAGVDPQDSRIWLALAEVNCRLQAVPAAIEAYGRAAELFRKNGFVRRAIAVYKNVLSLAPERLQTRLDLAAAATDLGLLSDAAQQYDSISSMLLQAGRAPEAVPVLERWWSLDHSNLNVLLRLGEACLEAGHEVAGQHHLSEAAQRLKREGHLSEYVRVAERLLARDAQSVSLRKSLARAYLDIGQADHALARLAPCCHADTQDGELLTLLAQAFESRGQIDKAVTVLRALGEVLHDQGALAQSLQAYRKILLLKPEDASAQARVNALGMGFLPEDWRTPTRDLVSGLPVVFPPLAEQPPTATPATQDESNTEPLFLAFGLPGATPAGKTQARVVAPAPPRHAQMVHPPFGARERPRSVLNDDPTALIRQEVLDAQLQRCDRGTPAAGAVSPLPASASRPADLATSALETVDELLNECTGLMEDMAAKLSRVLQLAPSHVGARERLAYVLLQLGRASEAVEHLTWLSERGRVAEPSWSPRRTEPSAVTPLR